MKIVTKLCLIILLTHLLFSCDISYLDKEIEDPTLEGSIKIPVGFINYNLSEVFNQLGSDGLGPTSTEEFSFNYTKTFTGENNTAFNVEVDDFTTAGNIENPIDDADLSVIGESSPYTIAQEISPGIINPLIGTYNEVSQIIYDLNLSQEITDIAFAGGILNINFNSTVNNTNIAVTIEIPSLTKKSDGSEYTGSANITGKNEETISIDLNDYNADLTNDGTGTGNTNNKMVLNVNASLTYAAGDIIDTNDVISFGATFSSISYDVIEGDFKQEPFNISSETIDLSDFFDNFNEGNITFDNTKMTINISNDYGFPIGIDLSSVEAISTNSSVNLNYTGTDPSLPNTIIIDGVPNFGDDEVVSNITLDNDNSNIGSLLESNPTSIVFNLSAISNPIDDGIINENFYASSNNGFEAELLIDFDSVNLNKEIVFNPDEDLENFKNIKIVTSVENKIPLTGNLLLEFKNSANQIIHTESLNAFNSANLDPSSGQSDGVAVLSNFEINLNENEINNIINTEKINIKVTLQLPEGESSVMIKGSDELNVRVGLEATGKI
jgi:hypothetical protein|uniref:Uncharacterized protein n=1 Tax=uncultured Polaribacter sp. TaxID=174711 RepID=F4MLE2_9FLAO|nr:hypothetical protein [uncultured bacterium]CBL80503.1 hypothetical protein S3_843_0013 [uncultured Polaribacter sp.]|tara:strand:+ start:364 stop:2022 length:1659 start_codon:yes stop_codon:yes gene_type:complete